MCGAPITPRIERMGLHAIAVASVLLFIAFAIMFIDRERDLHFRWKPSKMTASKNTVT